MATLDDVLELARKLSADDRRRVIERLRVELGESPTGADRLSAIAKELGAVDVVDAVFARRDENGVVHVYTIVREHEDDTYDSVIAAERRLDERFPGECFAFHIRAHQGREPAMAAPTDLTPVFLR